jgi:chitodextrinase
VGHFDQRVVRRLAAAAATMAGCLLALAPLSASAAIPTARAISFHGAQPVAATGAASTPAVAVNHPRGFVPRRDAGAKPGPASSRSASQSVFANPQCPACRPPLLFHQGNVMGGFNGTPGQVTITPVYWAPSGYTFAASYKAVINGYLANVAADSQKSTNVFSVATQYYQQTTPSSTIQHIQYLVTAGSEVDDSATFPAQGGASGCTAATGFSACVTDAALQSELQSRLPSVSAPIDAAHVYVVFFPAGVETCLSAGNTSCSAGTTGYCAYHGGPPVAASSALLYTNEPYPDLSACVDPVLHAQAPNGDSFADAQVSLVSHEASEAITDSFNTWYDSAGYENGDECAYVYGSSLGSTLVTTDAFAMGTAYNQSIGTGKYWTQDEFSNQDFSANMGDPNTAGGQTVLGCRQRDELPTASFVAPATAVVGTSTQFNGSASSDPDNSSALSYSWNWGDGTANGTGAMPTHVFTTTGTDTVTLTVTDGDGWVGSVSHPISVIVTAPGAPTGVAGAAGNTQVALTWTAPASTGGSAITGYRVTPFVAGVAQPMIATGSAATSYTVMGLTNGTTYTFTVAATNSVGTGSDSSPSSPVTPIAVPGAPTGVAGTAGNAQVALTWTAPTSSGGSAIIGYRVTPFIGGAAQTATATGSTATSYTVTGLANGTTYTFTVAATNSAGTGPPSNQSSSLTPLTVPAAPTGVAGTAGNAQVALTWTPPANNGGAAISGYTVTPYIGAAAQTAIATGSASTSFTVTGLTNGTTYTFTVAATNSAGTGPASAASNPTTPTPAAVPSGSLGGVAISGPAVASSASDRVDSFVAGTDLGLWQDTWNGTQWVGWRSLGGILTADPSATSSAANHIDIFVRGTDFGLWHRQWDGASWSNWELLGGYLTSGPGAASQGANRLDILARGTDNALYRKSYDSAGWHDWERVGGILTSDPRSVSWGAGRLDVVVRGTDNALWHTWLDSGGWHPWERLGGVLVSTPAISSCGAGKLDVFAVGTDSGLWRTSFVNGAWGNWQSLGGQWTSAPAAVCRQGASTTDVFARASDSTIGHLAA